jgi:hypothetical protein
MCWPYKQKKISNEVFTFGRCARYPRGAAKALDEAWVTHSL